MDKQKMVELIRELHYDKGIKFAKKEFTENVIAHVDAIAEMGDGFYPINRWDMDTENYFIKDYDIAETLLSYFPYTLALVERFKLSDYVQADLEAWTLDLINDLYRETVNEISESVCSKMGL